MGAQIKALNLMMACISTQEAAKDGRITGLYKKNKRVTVAQYAVALGYTPWDEYPSDIVRQVSVNDRKTALLEMQDIHRFLVEAQNQAK
jgi:hypothetical protein